MLVLGPFMLCSGFWRGNAKDLHIKGRKKDVKWAKDLHTIKGWTYLKPTRNPMTQTDSPYFTMTLTNTSSVSCICCGRPFEWE